MMKKAFLFTLLCFLGFPADSAELLGHISEETEQPITDIKPAPADDRRIIYRVICSPNDEALPDCEKPLLDIETVEQAQPLASQSTESEVVQAQETENAAEPHKAQKSGKKTRKSHSAKKSKASKKTAGKKTVVKKKKH